MDDKTKTKIIKTTLLLYEDNFEIDQIEKAIVTLFSNEKYAFDCVKSGIEMYKSLLLSVHNAGGAPDLSANKLNKMTVIDLISRLAINHIRFIYQKPEKEIDE